MNKEKIILSKNDSAVNTEQKQTVLLEILKSMKRVVIAFSGGVDSTLLLYAAKQALGDNAMGVTIAGPYIPQWEVDEAIAFTKEFGIRHTIIKAEFLEELRESPEDRCYVCKSFLFSQLQEFAAKENAILIEGTNHDDLGDYRPGLKALSELKVRSPLLEAKLTKQEIRDISEKWNLPTWDKPAYACLLTRIPFGTHVTEKSLRQIEASETALMTLGFRAVRVRHYGNLARIELPPDRLQEAATEPMRTKITKAIKKAGYQFATLDLSGYSMGSLNPNK